MHIDLIDPDSDNWLPGWRPLLRVLRPVGSALVDGYLVWETHAGVFEHRGWGDFGVVVDLACRVLKTMCDQCGGLNTRHDPVVDEHFDGLAIRCGAHDPGRPQFDGAWGALDQDEWVVTPMGDTLRIAELTPVDRAHISAWLLDEALAHALEARERALVDGNKTGSDDAILAAINIPAHQAGPAQTAVETSLLMSALMPRRMKNGY